jgi:hypothetical protein
MTASATTVIVPYSELFSIRKPRRIIETSIPDTRSNTVNRNCL